MTSQAFHVGQAHRQLPSYHHQTLHTCVCLSNLNERSLTFLMVLNPLLVDDVIGVVLALGIRLLISKLAFIKMVEDSVIGHDVAGVERTLHCLRVLTHNSYYY